MNKNCISKIKPGDFLIVKRNKSVSFLTKEEFTIRVIGLKYNVIPILGTNIEGLVNGLPGSLLTHIKPPFNIKDFNYFACVEDNRFTIIKIIKCPKVV